MKSIQFLSSLILFLFVVPVNAQTQEELKNAARTVLERLGYQAGDDFTIERISTFPGRYDDDPSFIVAASEAGARVYIRGSRLEITMVTFDDPQGARSRGLNFDATQPILTKQRAHEIGQSLLEIFDLPSNVVLESERWTEGVQSAGKTAKGRGTIGLSYYSKPHGIYDGFGNHLSVIMDHQSGEFESILIRNGYTYEEPTNLITLNAAKSIAAQALNRKVADVTHSKLVYIKDFGATLKGGPRPREKSKRCVLAYSVQFGRALVMVIAKTGDVEYVDELGAASGPSETSVASENQVANSRGNVLPLESVGSGTSDGSKRVPASWLIFPGVIIAAGLIVWKVRRPKGG